jgi:8-oxo-dGTP diphosphatase
MSDYTTRYHYCPNCGKPLQKSIIDDQPRSTCTNCSYVNWGDFSLGVGGVLWHNGKVLLVQRSNNPGKGMWTIPGGYVDQGESIGEAVIREIQEETGIKAEPLSIIALRDRPGEKHNTYIIFLMRFLGGNLLGQADEVSNLGFFTIEECQILPIPALTLSALEASHSFSPGLVFNPYVKLSSPLSKLYQLP